MAQINHHLAFSTGEKIATSNPSTCRCRKAQQESQDKYRAAEDRQWPAHTLSAAPVLRRQ